MWFRPFVDSRPGFSFVLRLTNVLRESVTAKHKPRGELASHGRQPIAHSTSRRPTQVLVCGVRRNSSVHSHSSTDSVCNVGSEAWKTSNL